MMRILGVLSVISLSSPSIFASAFRSYGKRYPNGHLTGFDFLGHTGDKNPDEGGSSNPRSRFGQDMSSNSLDWATVCAMDSDGDGKTNGEELGDPDCTWKRGDDPPTCHAPSDPRDATQALECGDPGTVLIATSTTTRAPSTTVTSTTPSMKNERASAMRTPSVIAIAGCLLL